MYAELKCKSNFSFLSGASDSREYIERASELRIPAIAITDTNGVYALPRAVEACKLYPDVKLIAGTELTLSNHPTITLIARNRKGYGDMCEIITALHAGKDKGEGRLTLNEFLDLSVKLNMATSDIVVLPQLEQDTQVDKLTDVFGEGIYLPLSRQLDGLDRRRSDLAYRFAKRFGREVVATNAPLYHIADRSYVQDSLTCVREGTDLRHAGFKLNANDERYLKSPLQMQSLFRDTPEVLQASLAIAESCTFKFSELTYTYPAELLPSGMTSQKYLEELVFKGAHRIYRGIISAKVDNQIRHELKVIDKLGFANYFLTIYDVVEYARQCNILYQGRGSAANSAICYCLRITAIDPVRSNLLFERFISEARGEPPDIDVDFEHERREEIIQYMYRRFGRDRAAMVSAVRTYRSKSSFIEMSKAVGIPVGVKNAKTLEADFASIAGIDADKLSVVKALSAEISEFPRHLSIHSGGFTLSNDPITRIVPTEPARMEYRTIVQWDKNDLDTIGLLKVDILGLGFLTALHKCCDLIGIDWHDIPAEDDATYDMICFARTEGCFQIESRAQKSMLPKNLPRTFYDLVVQVAIVRPGPGEGHMVHPFLKRRMLARKGIPYVCPDSDYEECLGRTCGVPLFQEQVMAIAVVKAGFTKKEADELRRSLGSFRSTLAVGAATEKLHKGLIKNGTPKPFADELLGYMKGFAHYGFPESHAASFALISYASAYLKCHHPAEFLCALLNSQPMGFYAIDTLISEAKRNGVKILPIHPNISAWDATMEGERTVRMGFCNIRKIRKEDVKEGERELTEADFKTNVSKVEAEEAYQVLLEERSKRLFETLDDFRARTKFSRDVMELMAMGNVFECFGLDQRHSLWKVQALENLHAGPRQLSLLLDAGTTLAEQIDKVLFKPMTLLEEIFAEYKVKGYSQHGNPMTELRKAMPSLPILSADKILKMAHGRRVHFAGMTTVYQSPPTAKGTGFITLEDNHGSLDTILRKDIHDKYRSVIQSGPGLIIKGRVQRIGGLASVVIDEVESFVPPGMNRKVIEHGDSGRLRGTFRSL